MSTPAKAGVGDCWIFPQKRKSNSEKLIRFALPHERRCDCGGWGTAESKSYGTQASLAVRARARTPIDDQRSENTVSLSPFSAS
jgi:hypothetical protein